MVGTMKMSIEVADMAFGTGMGERFAGRVACRSDQGITTDASLVTEAAVATMYPCNDLAFGCGDTAAANTMTALTGNLPTEGTIPFQMAKRIRRGVDNQVAVDVYSLNICSCDIDGWHARRVDHRCSKGSRTDTRTAEGLIASIIRSGQGTTTIGVGRCHHNVGASPNRTAHLNVVSGWGDRRILGLPREHGYGVDGRAPRIRDH